MASPESPPHEVPPRKRRILLLSTRPDWGGGEEQLRLLIEGLPHEGWEVLLAAPKGSALARLPLEKPPIVQLPGRGRNPRAWYRLRRTLRRDHPHVLWMNDPHAILHGLIAAVGIRMLRVGARRTIFPLRSGRLYRIGLDCVVCPSQAAAAACRIAGIPDTSLAVIYAGVDLTRIDTADPHRGRRELHRLTGRDPARDSARFLVHVGKLTPAKGQEDLVEAFAELARLYPDTFLVLIGEGESRAALEEKIAARGLAGRVILAGFRQDALDLVGAADLFVFPSRQEGLGGAVIEALLLGVPVVASTAGGIPEIFAEADPAVGWKALVAPGDVGALREAVLRALQASPELRRIWGAQAKAYARGRFAAERMVRQTARLLDRLMDRFPCA